MNKLECSKRTDHVSNRLAWDNETRPNRGALPGVPVGPNLLVSGAEVMINRDGWGRSYSVERGEILRPIEDEQVRRHSTRMFSLIKNESYGIEDDQIPS